MTIENSSSQHIILPVKLLKDHVVFKGVSQPEDFDKRYRM